MQYTFNIITKNKEVLQGQVTSASDFTDCVFGYVPYGMSGSCTLPVQVIADFWVAVDTVLAANGRTSADFARVVQAIDDQGKIYGSSTFDPTDLIL